MRSGFSSIRRTDSEFGKAVRESFWSCIVADLEEVEHKNYDELGIYRFIVPEINSQSMKEYMEEYLKPLTEDDGELLRTAKTYVLTGGELPALILTDAVARLQQGVLPSEGQEHDRGAEEPRLGVCLPRREH